MIDSQAIPLTVALFALLLLVALGLLTRPWWSRRIAVGLARRGANIAAYRGRVVEIDRDVEAGVIPADQAKMLKDEAAERLLGDTLGESTVASNKVSSRIFGLIVAVVITAAASAAYWKVGAWRPPPPETAQAQPGEMPPQVQAMVQKLADRLAQQPDDISGWAQLGRAYFVMKRFADSVKAYHEVNSRNGGADAETLTSEGEAIAFSSQMRIPDEARALFAHALKLDPEQNRALWYDGLASAQAGDLATARADWTGLRSHPLPEQMKPVLDKAIAELAASEDEAGAPAGGTPAAPMGKSAAAQSIMLKSGAVSLKLRVKLAPQLAAKLDDAATLFVYAKADGGPPMPLAVYRAQAAKFPVEVTLDDSMAMAPTMRLSAFPRYVVTARLSRSGQAQPQSGDLEGSAHLERQADSGNAGGDKMGGTKAGDQVHEIVIDQAIP